MNHNIKNIILTYSIITGNEDKNQIIGILSESDTFRQLQNNDQILLYEGYTANLIEIIDELKEQPGYPVEIDKITPDTIRIVNRARRLSGEGGKKLFYSIFKSKSGNFNAKKASRKAHKKLREQGFYM